jgi:hypothetical protein
MLRPQARAVSLPLPSVPITRSSYQSAAPAPSIAHRSAPASSASIPGKSETLGEAVKVLKGRQALARSRGRQTRTYPLQGDTRSGRAAPAIDADNTGPEERLPGLRQCGHQRGRKGYPRGEPQSGVQRSGGHWVGAGDYRAFA